MTLLQFLPASLLFLPSFVYAQGYNLSAAGGLGLKGDLVGLLATVIKIFLALVGVAALGYMVYGGFLYITSGGDDKQISRGKTTITGAVIGIIVIGLAYAIVSFALNSFR